MIFVNDAEVIDLANIGPQQNITYSRIGQIFPLCIKCQKSFECGCGNVAGHYLACGSGACAVGVAVYRSGRGSRRNEIIMDGGSVFIDWQDDGTVGGRVIMSGPVAHAFNGILSAPLDGLLRVST